MRIAACRFCLFLALLLGQFLFACGSTDSAAVSDGDTSDAEREEAADPCLGVACGPGTCSSDYLGRVYCRCPGGVDTLPSVGCPYDGDIDLDTLDGDSDSESDADLEPEKEREIDYDDPVEKLPACKEGGTTFPCHLVDFPFTYTNNEGEFRIGYPSNWAADFPYVYKGWIGFTYKINESTWPAGAMLTNYYTQQTVMLADKSSATYASQGVVIGENRVVWNERINPTQSSTIYLYQSPLNQFSRTLLLGTETYKEYSRIVDGNLYFNGGTEGQQRSWDLWVIPEGSNTPAYASPSRSRPQSPVSVNKKRAVFMASTTRVRFVDMTEKTETTLIDDNFSRTDPILTGDYVFWSDLSLSKDDAGICGWSLFQYNLKTKEKTVLKATTGFNDYFASSAWGDWLIYQDTSEGGGDAGDPYCYMAGADSDVYLRNIPTGEEWNLSHHTGAQWAAMMDDHLVVWLDGRERTGARLMHSDIYGIDLCLHPQLKERFESCKAAKK